ncbi:hypothetical protein GNI_078300 [Gregarina niphandrodes]|uniref:Uncharacterized protein n=1 Tax=Gregarina niphandrodes TaxID=110365 RepID=A0A023B6N7_GRENI|nr:hypothetical protein GNI_078300 [Gregarina niphandrodes]EZG66636.1 hypothetical protein GNI_078300 [Gregarina niphandrodes]|eukprot:XP_011130565.1 hypothetical protein GNI_078300 [Gregarina niphandrodes]
MGRDDEWGTGSSKRRRTSHEWEQPQHMLFDEPEFREVDRRLERAIAEITLEMLEAVRLSPSQLLHILEHPRCSEYLVGAYVRYPDLEEMENGDVDESQYYSIPPLPAQITKLIPREEGPTTVTIENEQHTVHYDFSIIQYTQRSDGSLKIRKGKMYLPLVQKAAFTESELRKWQNLLKMFSGRQGYEKLQSLPLILPATAAKLQSFTFTNDDVDLVLKKKFNSDGPFAHVATLNFRDLYIRKSELEYNIRGKEEELNETTSEEAIEAIREEIGKLQAELDVVIERVSQHESSIKASGETRMSVTSGAVGKDALDVPGSVPETSWKSYDWVKIPRSLSWRQPMSYLDMVYPLKPASEKEVLDRLVEWKQEMKTRTSVLSSQFAGTALVGKRMPVEVSFHFPAPRSRPSKEARPQAETSPPAADLPVKGDLPVKSDFPTESAPTPAPTPHADLPVKGD